MIFPKSQNFETAFLVESNPLSMGWSQVDPTKKGLNSSPLKSSVAETAYLGDNGEFSVEVEILTVSHPLIGVRIWKFSKKTGKFVPKKNRHLSWSAHAFLKFHTPHHQVALGRYIEASILSQAPSFLNIITDGFDSLMIVFPAFFCEIPQNVQSSLVTNMEMEITLLNMKYIYKNRGCEHVTIITLYLAFVSGGGSGWIFKMMFKPSVS